MRLRPTTLCENCAGWWGEPFKHKTIGWCCPGCLAPWNGPLPLRRRFGSRGAPGAKRRKAVYKRDGYRCVDCGAPEGLTLDHIIPRSKGGTNQEGNLQTMCKPCNNRKADTMPGDSHATRY